MSCICQVEKLTAMFYCKYQSRSEVVVKTESDAKFYSYLSVPLFKHDLISPDDKLLQIRIILSTNYSNSIK